VVKFSRALLVFGVGWVTASLSGLTHAQTAAATAPDVGRGGLHRQVVNDYCIGCHNQRARTGGLALDSPDLGIADHREIWEKVLRKVRTRAMPPQGARRPEPATYSSLVTALETELDRAAASTPHPGRPLLRRLNRTEYANAVRDLLALDVDVASMLPPDDSAYGFDNIADVLGLSPVLLERYLTAAERLSALAVGDPDTGLGSQTYRLRQDLSQDQHVDGLPLGTVGGALIHHTFPLDGEYVLKATLFRNHTDGTRGLEHPHQLEITVDGERVFLGPVGGEADFRALYADSTPASDAIDRRLNIRVPVKAGPRAIGVAFVLKSLATNSRKLRPYLRSSFNTYDYTGLPHISTLTIAGPYDATGPGETPSRRRIFSCRPSSASAEEPCAVEIVRTLARRAYRRAPAPDDVQRLMRFYREERRARGFDAGIQMVVQRILSSPKFILRAEEDPPGVAPGAAYRVADVDLASRLSFFLWSSIPDDELQTAALHDPEVLGRQVRRMLADARADALVTSFADQWLQLRNLQNVIPNSDTFPDFDDNLRQAFRRETQLLFASIMREDRSIHELLTADYTFVNERLAKHYGMRNVYGSQFRRVPLTGDARRGLLGHGSILTVTSHPTRTSPVVRGKWILDNLLGTPPPPAPPNVPSLRENEAGAPARTMREQLAEHRSSPACASCHKVMDPIGFALENFDAVGAWRARDADTPIDASGELFDGTRVDGAVALREALLARPDVFVEAFIEKLLTYALGRGLDYRDMPTVRAIRREAAKTDYRFSSIVLAIVRSAPFQMRIKRDGA
jgi:mono/diheme cytochrome c family protein